MVNFRNLTLQERRLKSGMEKFNSRDKSLILEALEVTKRAHEGQKRDEGDPYIIHPIRVANTLIYDLDITDAEMIITGLLHDVVEDTGVLTQQIKEQFGSRVAGLTKALTRDKEKETKREKFEKTVKGPKEVRLIKTCDWLDNLRSFVYRTDRGERWQRHIKEAREMYIPLVEAVGNGWLMKEMKKAYEAVLRLLK